VELIKIRLQAQYSQEQRIYRGPVHCAQSIIRDEGGVMRGLFRGFWSTVAREIPAYAGFYCGYEFIVRRLRKDSQDKPAPWKLMLAGSCGGISYWTCCYPLDVIKSQVQNSKRRLSYGYILSTAAEIWHKGRIHAYYKGFTPTILRR
jgi:solute carrier family 25 carnitine/acylcarnitine transporter 20/29